MIPLKESEIVPTLKMVYNKVKTSRPHFSEEARRTLVEKKMLKDYSVTVTKDLYDKINEQPKQLPKNPSKKPILIKRDITQGQWCLKSLPVERKREYKHTTVDQRIQSIVTSTAVKKTKSAKVKNDCTFRENKQQPYLGDKDDLDKTLTSTDVDQKPKTVFDRLYESRHKPSPTKVARVKHLREAHGVKSLTNKPFPVKKSCHFHEPPQKRHRYSRDCLNGTLNSSVFERLYDERKQFNTKKLTDTQKRENYLRQQREKGRNSEAKFGDTSSICKCCCDSSSSTESATSDFDVQQDKVWSESECGENFEPRVISFDDTIVDSNSCDTFNFDGELQKVHSVLDSLTMNFNQHMSLCHIDERDLVE